MSGLKQPWIGVVATALIIAVALGFISRFTLAIFTGWLSYFLLCVIPMQIIVAVMWGSNPAFTATRTQATKGLLLTATTLVIGAIVAALSHATIGGRISPPTPMLVMCAIVSVVITFWAAIMWGGWPFTTLIKNPIAAGLTTLVACYIVNYGLFRVFFDYGFMQGAPVYVAEQDPHGLFPAWYALVFYLSCLSAMFLMVNFDLWPLTAFPGVMRQPRLGAAWTLAVLVIGGLAYYVGVGVMGIDPVAFMVRVPVPFIFGTIVVQNMLQGSLFAKYTQPFKGILNVAAVVVIGQLLAQLYAVVASTVSGPVSPGPPAYEFEVWLASALLSVTFPFLIFHAEFFRFWPLQRAPAQEAQAIVR
ncbi:MAG: hypothetical protein C5B57_03960 [Blastocatellia bacterium]|nr:MAG: hypothetical protein C5B57_03960 [Blastocatellia bacterium]